RTRIHLLPPWGSGTLAIPAENDAGRWPRSRSRKVRCDVRAQLLAIERGQPAILTNALERARHPLASFRLDGFGQMRARARVDHERLATRMISLRDQAMMKQRTSQHHPGKIRVRDRADLQ